MFNYILEKIEGAKIVNEPFDHIYIEDLFLPNHFKAIVEDPQISLAEPKSDKDLIRDLRKSGYDLIKFPGCTTNESLYLKWHQKQNSGYDNVNTCEGFGIAFRLKKPGNKFLSELVDFFGSELFFSTISQRFGVDISKTTSDSGLQKYLDGYEISPHADVRRKAITYMVNINPGNSTEDLDFHTHYMKFESSKEYVYSYWRNNPDMDRCWVPWNWCKTAKRQTQNNSIVIFSPNDYSLHAIRAKYDHLKLQRTQLYGNLWYKNFPIGGDPCWEDLEVVPTKGNRTMSPISKKISDYRERLRLLLGN